MVIQLPSFMKTPDSSSKYPEIPLLKAERVTYGVLPFGKPPLLGL